VSERTVVDLSILIELRRTRRLRELTPVIRAGRIAVVNYALKKLNKPSWRKWLDDNRASIEVRLLPGREQARFANLLVKHAPLLADDDVMAITIALERRWDLAMRDSNAERAARALGVDCIGLEGLLPPAPRQLPLPDE
jgi:hypothetical protein